MSPAALLEKALSLGKNAKAHLTPTRELLIDHALTYGEAVRLKTGALATWGSAHATGRIPLDTYAVRHPDDRSVDWLQPNNHAITPQAFDALFEEALTLLSHKDHLYVTDQTVGAEPSLTLPVRTITDSALTALFTQTMFRPTSTNDHLSRFRDAGFTLLVLPRNLIDVSKYHGILREVKGRMVEHGIFMDFQRHIGIVFGTTYLGAVKKLLFTAMNCLLPAEGVLPLHCAAVEDERGATHLFLGLSGTGKTTLSTGPGLTMIGDDEHLWSHTGIANMEGGCYAKLMNLSPKKEPEIFEAVFGPVTNATPIVENAMVYPDGNIDLSDARLTENSRAAYPLSRLKSVKPTSRGTHPSTIIFLTADARGVLPPVAKLPLREAMLWFLMGYTSKLAGTEMGIVSPQSTFSRFFGGAFMPRASGDYLTLFQALAADHNPDMYLVNTGWSGGAYGVGKRMDIAMTRSIVNAALSGSLRDVPYREDKLFHLLVPRECPGVEPATLHPESTWSDPSAYKQAASALAQEFSAHFDKICRGNVLEALRDVCPGK